MSNKQNDNFLTPESCPVVFLAFADDLDNPLKMIEQEQDFISKALIDFEDKNFLRVRKTSHVSTEKLFASVNRYSNRLSIFHFGGHAGEDMLQFEPEAGKAEIVQAKGIAGLLGTEKNLKLVFLNGCATYGQVAALLDYGVPAVIATSRNVRDDLASRFAKAFYNALGAGNSLKIAFNKAKAWIETTKDPPEILDWKGTRGINLRKMNLDSKMPWGLYTTENSKKILDWKLPQIQYNQFVIRPASFTPAARLNINSEFVIKIFKAIYSRGSIFAKSLIARAREEKKVASPSDVRDAILRSFPSPVSIKLRSLFALEKDTEFNHQQYLSHILDLFREISKFLAYISLSQLCDELNRFREENRILTIEESEHKLIKEFFALNSHSQAFFNYFSLFNTILQILYRNEITFHISEFRRYKGNMVRYKKVGKILRFIIELEEEFQEGFHNQRSMQIYTEQATLKLTELLTLWSFLVNYKMAVVKYIELRQCKYLPKKFITNLVELDNNKNVESLKDITEKYEEAADTEAVVLYKKQLFDGINLSPFMIDENALGRKPNSKIYFFSHCLDNGDLCYYLLENRDITLQVNKDNYSEVKKQFEIVRKWLLGEETPEKEEKELKDKDSSLDQYLHKS